MAEIVGQDLLADVDLHVRQGSDCAFVLTYAEDDGNGVVNQPFTGWTVRSQIRKAVGGEIWLDLGTHLTLTDAAGTLTVTGLIPAAVTEDTAWNARASKVVAGELAPAGVWDVELVTETGQVIPLAGGAVYVTPDVTRAA